MTPVYLDYNATTPLDPRVLDVMTPWLLRPSNSGSRTHRFGQEAKTAADDARDQVATLLDAQPEEVVFTSGATEGNNIAILGLAAFGQRTGRRHIISTSIEHKAVLEPLERLRSSGFEIDLVPVTNGGFVEPETIAARLRPDTLLVSVMHANNETGVLQPVEKIAALLTGTDTYFHVDAAQTFGKEVDALRSLAYDLLSISSHKIYGPQGVGALHVRRRRIERRAIEAVMFGGGQERGLRPGTLPVALVVGLGEASRLAASEHQQRRQNAARVRREFLAGLDGVEFQINGDQTRCQSHVINISFRGIDSEALMMQLRDVVSVSNGSACTSSQYAPSHVLTAMGVDEASIESSVRISWGVGVDSIPAECFVEAVNQMRV